MPARARWRRFIGPKRTAVLLLYAGGAALAWWLRRRGWLEPGILIQYRERRPGWSMIAFVGAYALSVIGTIPTLPLNLAAGALWGPWLGGFVACAAMTLGSCGSFMAARSLAGQPLARRFDSRLVSWLQHELDLDGWRFVAFLRLNPILPTGPLNYILGLTSIGAMTYLWSTFAFLLPPATLVAFIGSSMGGLWEDGELRNVGKVTFLAAGAITLLVLIRYAAKYLGYRRSYDDDPSRPHAE